MASPLRILAENPSTFIVLHSQGSQLALADSAIVKSAKSENVKKKRMECFRFINSAFPFYIPLEQHGMASGEMASLNGGYWANAMLFLLSNKAHGFAMWKKLQEQMRSMHASDECRPHISTLTANRFFRIFSENDDLGFQTLYQDINIIGLAFQPVLLFQCLTTAIHELNTLEDHLCPFYYFPFPVEFGPSLRRLRNVLKTTYQNVGFLFDYLQHQVESENEIFVGNLKLFDEVLGKVLRGVEFCCSAETGMFVNELKKKSYLQGTPSGTLCTLKRTSIPFLERNFLFNLDFWRQIPSRDVKLFGSSNEKLVRKVHAAHWDRLINPIDVGLILDGQLQPAGMKKIKLKDMMKDPVVMERLQHMHRVRNLFKLLRIKTSEKGILGGFIDLSVRNENLSALFEFIKTLSERFNVPWRLLYDFERLIISDLDAVPSLPDEEKTYSIEEMLNHVKKRNESLPILDVGDWFQWRIERIILNCAEMQLKIKNFEEEKDEKLRDWQVAQYLLPCFVASFNNICNISPPIDDSFTIWYEQFVDRLISAYEGEGGIRKSSWANIKKDIEANPILRDDTDLLGFFENAVHSFNEKIRGHNCSQLGEIVKFCPPLKAMYEVLSKNKQGSSHNDDISSEPSIYWNWLMWDFFNKMKSAI